MESPSGLTLTGLTGMLRIDEIYGEGIVIGVAELPNVIRLRDYYRMFCRQKG